MKSSALIRYSVLLGLLLMMIQNARAGSIDMVMGTAVNDPNTYADDMLVQTPLRWYPDANVFFCYRKNPDGSVLSDKVYDSTGKVIVNDNDRDPAVPPFFPIASVERALGRWKNAPYANLRKFTIRDATLVPVDSLGQMQMPDGNRYSPSGIAVDGYNFIDFQGGAAGTGQTSIQIPANVPALTVISYFYRDFPVESYVAGTIPNPQIEINVITNQGGAAGPTVLAYTNWNYPGQGIGGGQQNQVPIPMWLALPPRNFKQGEIFDVDIAISDALVTNQIMRCWPDNINQLTTAQRSDVPYNLDLDMIMMHEFGWAFGLGNSMIFDSVMYPYYYRKQVGGADPVFLTDQFRKRQFSFDDELTMAQAWAVGYGTPLEQVFPARGAISGQILDGAQVGATTPFNTGTTQQQTGTQTGGTGGTTTQPGPQQTNQTQTQSPFIAQVPVFVGVKTDQLSNLPITLTSGRVDLAQYHADNILTQPTDPADTNYGTWRMYTHVLSGQGLAIPASQGPNQTATGGAAGGSIGIPTGGTGGGTGTQGQYPGPDIGTTSQVSRLNGLYVIPGLPDKDTTGKPIDYAVYLPSQIYQNGGTAAANSFYLNPFRSEFIPTQTASLYTFPNEFYGGVDVPFQFGQGNAPIVFNSADDLFMSNYIIGEMDKDGRFAAAINQGPSLLSGYNTGPLSYAVLTLDDKYYSNRQGPFAKVVTPVVVADPPQLPGQVVNNTAQAGGAWEEEGKFRIKTQMRISTAGGLVGIPAGLEVIYTVTNLSGSSATMNLRQVLDTNVFGRENPVYMVNNKYVNNSTTYAGDKIPREIVFQSWSTTSTAIRGFLDVTGGTNTTPTWVTIGTLPELTRVLSGPGVKLRDMSSIGEDSGIALGWTFSLGDEEQKIIRFVVGYYPGGWIYDSWVPYPATLQQGQVLSGYEDDPHSIRPVNVTPGVITDGIDIFTNTFTGTVPQNINQKPPEGSATGLLQFIRMIDGFPDYRTYYTMGGALGDLDNDGDLDVVTCAINGNNPGAGALNRIYLNEQRINADGSVTRYFRDVTLGDNPNDPTSSRLLPTHQGDNTYSVVLADFDDDGWLEIFFTKRGSSNSYYDNLGPEKPAYFVEDPEAVPPLLNQPSAESENVPFRAAAGDIDSDGDIDLIISQWEPFYVYDLTNGNGVSAWIDDDGDGRMSHSRDNWTDTLRYCERVLINYKYTPSWAAGFAGRFSDNGTPVVPEHTEQLGTFFVDETLGTDDVPGSLTSLVTARYDNIYQWPIVLSWDPSELDRMPPLCPFYVSYADQTLAATDYNASPMGYFAVEPRLGPLFGGSALDLMSVRTNFNSLMGPVSSHLVAITRPWSPAPPDYVGSSVASLGFTPGAGYNGTDSAFFRNMDLFSHNSSTGDPMEVVGDGIPDGYFGCMNYNNDYGLNFQQIISASNPGDRINTNYGLFVYEEDIDTSANRANVRYDAFPLFIGIPDSQNSDIKPPVDPEVDIVPAASGRTAFAGLIGDWENAGRPLPLILTDNNSPIATAEPYLYSMINNGQATLGILPIHRGYTPAGGVYSYGGIACQYFDSAIYPYVYNDPQTQSPWALRDFNQPTANEYVQDGQPYGAASGDFDLDGDEDLFFVNSSDSGVDRGLNPGKAPKQVFTNDSFGNFTEALNVLSTNEAVNGMYCAVGDLDNDSDPDLVSFNMLGPNEGYINQAFTKPPDPLNDEDPTMFFDATYRSIPNIMQPSFTGPQGTWRGFRGVTVAAAVSDLNLDGRPDLLLAEGGQNTQAGDYARVLLNGGKPMGDAVPIYKPAGAAYPAPRTDLWIHNLVDPQGNYSEDFYGVKHWAYLQRPAEQMGTSFLEGYMGGPAPGFVNDAQAGDVDKDGDPDVLIVRAGGGKDIYGQQLAAGPQLLINNDSNSQFYNSIPDNDNLGDAIFSDGNLIKLLDPDNPAGSNNLTFKNQGQAARFADFNGDGCPDIVIANGYPGDQSSRGAPNVILMNSRELPGNFTDETEQRLPAVTESGFTRGVYDNTIKVVVGDFDSDGDVDIIFANEATPNAPLGFRFLLNDGDGVFSEVPQNGRGLPSFVGPGNVGRKIKGIIAADLDGLGEATEDKNHNGVLDPGEDSNGNGVIDWEDLPTETEDLNGNGQLDDGEDGRIGPANGRLDYYDINNDGIYTARRDGTWEGSLDLVITFDNDLPVILINDTTGRYPGNFHDESSSRMTTAEMAPYRGVDVGDINLDGYPDIVIALNVGGITRPVSVWLNQPKIANGKVKWGFFKDITHEVPYPYGESMYDEISQNIIGPYDASEAGWYTDVKLLDIDGDGDLDMFVSGGSFTNQSYTIGTQDLMYMNRVVGDSFNFQGYNAQKQKSNPSVYSIEPRGAKRGTTATITVTGENFQSGTLLSFGNDITIESMSRLDANNLSVTLKVAPAAALGPRAVLAQNPSGSAVASKVGLFNVYDKTLPNEVPDRTWSLYE